MSTRIIAGFLLLIAITSGCQSTTFSRRFQQAVGYREGNSPRQNPAEQTTDPWIQEAGTVARTEHNVETVNDPLKLRNVFMSSKARDIERNLGVGQ